MRTFSSVHRPAWRGHRPQPEGDIIFTPSRQVARGEAERPSSLADCPFSILNIQLPFRISLSSSPPFSPCPSVSPWCARFHNRPQSQFVTKTFVDLRLRLKAKIGMHHGDTERHGEEDGGKTGRDKSSVVGQSTIAIPIAANSQHMIALAQLSFFNFQFAILILHFLFFSVPLRVSVVPLPPSLSLRLFNFRDNRRGYSAIILSFRSFAPLRKSSGPQSVAAEGPRRFPPIAKKDVRKAAAKCYYPPTYNGARTWMESSAVRLDCSLPMASSML